MPLLRLRSTFNQRHRGLRRSCITKHNQRMHANSSPENVMVFLVAAVIAVLVFRRFGFGAVLGYLAAGVVIGPSVLKLVSDTESVLAVSELGVVMMLFVIGLELSPARLWVMRRPVFLVGGAQVFVSALLIAG